MAALRSAIWPPGTLLRVLFGAHGADPRFGGTQAQRAEVMAATRIISQHANLHFAEIDHLPALSGVALIRWLAANPTIRCSFDPKLGSFSYVGKEILDVAPEEPTMNIGWPNDIGRSIHEGLHSAGCEHEHESFSVPWNTINVFDYFEGPPNFWSASQVQDQVLAQLDPALLIRTTSIDVNSIMMYPFAPPLVRDPRYATGFKTGLSVGDIAMMRQLWPF